MLLCIFANTYGRGMKILETLLAEFFETIDNVVNIEVYQFTDKAVGLEVNELIQHLASVPTAEELDAYFAKDESQKGLVVFAGNAKLKKISSSTPVIKKRRLLKTIKRRKSLSPEQQVEGETLELAVNDYKLKISVIGTIEDRLLLG